MEEEKDKFMNILEDKENKETIRNIRASIKGWKKRRVIVRKGRR